MAQVRIGCSGFNYPHWKGTFYPEGLPQKQWLSNYCAVFSSVELNVTFYRLPRQSTFEKWYSETPDNFIFALKGSRFITHIKRLIEPNDSLRLFFAGALHLKDKLEIVLWQFPPAFRADIERLKKFIKLLRKYPVRNTLEFRNETWISEEVIDLCGKQNISLCMADWPAFLENLPVTSDFVYIRRHGAGGHDACYSRAELKKDAQRIKQFVKQGKDVYIYFNNDAFGYAPANAKELASLL
ncbi:MAG: DUF72 domain-containing protein [bacterium]